MSPQEKPPFRADQVGSLIRPKALREARQAWLGGTLSEAGLRDIEDRCIGDVIAMQERVGLAAITDGEFRRTSFREVLFDNVDGFSTERVETDFAFNYADGSTRRATPVPKVVAPLRRRGAMAAKDFAFLKSHTRKTAKAMLPAPSFAHWFIGDKALAGSLYSDTASYLADVARVYREEIATLAALGCSYLQIDEVPIPVMSDPKVQAIIARRGEDYRVLIDLYVDAINAAIKDRP